MNKPSQAISPETIQKITEAFVQKGYDPIAISALVDLSLDEVVQLIESERLEAKRSLFLAENPNISARLANQYQLASILKKRQGGAELSSSELTFLTKLADQQRSDTEVDQTYYYNLSKAELDKEIEKLRKQVYSRPTHRYAPRRSRRK